MRVREPDVHDRAFHRAKHVAKARDYHMLHLQIRQRLLQHTGKILEHDDGFRARVGKLKFQFAWLVERVDVHDRAAGAQDGDDGDRILQHVGHHDGDARATFQAPVLQPGCERTR